MASIVKRTYTVKTAAGIVTRKCKTYSIEYAGADGKRHRVKGYKDKGATFQLAARLEKAAALGFEGLTDPFKEQKARQTTEHVKEYVADLRTSGADGKYCENMNNRLSLLVKECGWAKLGDVEPNGFIVWREQRRIVKHRGTRSDLKGTSAATLNQYLDSVRAFLNWCASSGRLEGIAVHGGRKVSSIMAGVSKVQGEKVRKRRGLTDDQVGKLLAAAHEDRAIVYRVGLAIGLRRQELKDLKWGEVQLKAIPPYVAMRAEATKSRRADKVFLPQTLADDLRKLRDDATSDAAPVFARVPSLVLWKNDLKTAGIPWEDEMGQRADFHGGTRKTLCTRMHRSGVPLAKAMRVMRHTDARLTMVDYTDDGQLGMQDTLAEVPAAVKLTGAAQAGA